MSTIGVSGGSVEYDAAQALLDLHSNAREDREHSVISLNDCKEDMEMTAKLFLSCFITTNATEEATTSRISESNSSFNVATNCNKNTTGAPKELNYTHSPIKDEVTKTINKSESSYLKNLESNNKRSKLFKRRPTKHPLSPCKKLRQENREFDYNSDDNVQSLVIPEKQSTREIGTQTDTEYQHPVVDDMESTIKQLQEKIRLLEAQISSYAHSNIVEDENNSEVESLENSTEISFDCQMQRKKYDTLIANRNTQPKLPKVNDGHITQTNSNMPFTALRTYNQNCNPNELVPIGEGHASIPSRILRHINWNSYTNATRKLLAAVFSRRVLATHSLTGKPSPAFPNKPAKKKLDSALVNDIVLTVVERCCVPENVVRTSITTKCADESKMYRTRQKNLRKRKDKSRENIPPDTSESEESN